MIRALVVDDEPLARQLLIRMLQDHTDIEVVGQAGSGTAAVKEIRALEPDLVFLDVQMPGMDGFEVIGVLRDHSPQIIFVTAYDHYALRAFEVHALDYLLKPFDEDRLAGALERARRQLTRKDDSGNERILSMLEELRRRDRYVERLVVKVGERVFLQPVQEVDWIEADGKFLKLHVGKDVHTIRETLSKLCTLLDPQQFARISRSSVVNIRRIREIQPWFRGEYVVVMKSGAQVTSTRSHRDALTRLMQYDV